MAIAAPPVGTAGELIGIDLITGQAVIHDEFDTYGAQLPSANVLVVGDLGYGKSALVKTVYGTRRLRRKGRQVAVITKKRGDGGGEFDRLCQVMGTTPVFFSPGDHDGVTINPLDPRIARYSTDVDEPDGPRGGSVTRAGQAAMTVGQDALVRTILEVVLKRPLTPREGAALRAALEHVHAAAPPGVQPTLRDLWPAMLTPSPVAAAKYHTSVDELREWGRDAALELDRMCEGDLAGLVDAPTSSDIDLGAPLVVFDVSALPEGDALSIVMAVVSTWLGNVWVRRDGVLRTFVVEETWHLITHASSARLLRRLYRLSRDLGMQIVSVIHHISDLPQEGDANREAIALLQDASVVYVLHQELATDAEDCRRVLGLSRAAADMITTLPQGCCLLKIGSRPPIPVRHLRSTLEEWLTDTDGAMKGETASPPVQGHETPTAPDSDEAA